jgi:hypothetical protein
MSEIRKFPAVEVRVETGPIQFGDDWPGVFMRGDNALTFANAIDGAIILLPHDQFMLKQMLIGLASDLRSCRVGDTGWPP